MRNFPTKSTDRDIESNLEWTNSVRFGSSSSQASQSSSGIICRICHCESDPQNPLFSPCYCSGTLKFVHQSCLQQWLTASATSSCELCKFPFVMHTKIKPFNEWRSLDMSGVERRRLLCAILFHAAGAICVVWSLCVLIERAVEEVNRGLIGWPFWTKLVVVTVGLTGGCVFMYIQCKHYLALCKRWRATNRILLIQNCPEKFHPPQSPQNHHVSGRLVRNNSSTTVVGGAAGVASAFSVNSSCGQTLSSRQHTIDLAGDATHENLDELDQSSSSALTYQHPVGHHHGRHYQHHMGQIVANIENSSTYDRDWTLDDISQASLFKPCQGSGSQADSLTPLPYHEQLSDSQSNIYNNSGGGGSVHHHSNIYNNPNINLQNCSVSTSSYEKIKSSSNGAAAQKLPNSGNDVFKVKTKHPNSAVFLENRDILNDSGAITSGGYSNPKHYHRHSTAMDYFPMVAPATALSSSLDFYENLDERIGPQRQRQETSKKDTRRYSDTKLLLQQQHEQHLQQYSNLNLCAGPSLHYGQAGSSVPQPPKANKYYSNRTTNKVHNNIVNIANVWGPETSIISPDEQPPASTPHQPQITDIIFENSQGSDPLELNIQELLELDIEYHNGGRGAVAHGRPTALAHDNTFKRMRLSVDNVLDDAPAPQPTRSATMYKSLPNLIANSNENLLP